MTRPRQPGPRLGPGRRDRTGASSDGPGHWAGPSPRRVTRTLLHVLTTGMWHGTTPTWPQSNSNAPPRPASWPGEARLREARAGRRLLCRGQLPGRPAGRAARGRAGCRPAPSGLPANGTTARSYCCLAYAGAFLQGDFDGAERWADETLKQNDTFGDDVTEGPHGVQMFMLGREIGSLDRFRRYLDGRETFAGRWVPGLLALYTELGVVAGASASAARTWWPRAWASVTDEAQWPMELASLTEAALALGDRDAVAVLRPLLAGVLGHEPGVAAR